MRFEPAPVRPDAQTLRFVAQRFTARRALG